MKLSREFAGHLTKAATAMERGDKWQMQFSGRESYEYTFKYLLGDKSIQNIIEKWDDKTEVAALDLMGLGTVFEELKLQHGLGVALSDARTPEIKAKHGQAIDVVAGNILERKTWNKIENWLQQQGLQDPRFKLALFRPIGGINFIPHNPSIVHALIQRLWKLMSNDEAELLAVAPYYSDQLAAAWLKKLNATPGISASLQTTQDILAAEQGTMVHYMDSPTTAIRLIKHAAAPEILPTIEVMVDPRSSSNDIRYIPKP